MGKAPHKKIWQLEWRPGISKHFLLTALLISVAFTTWKIYTEFLVKNTPDENSKISNEAIDQRDHGKCNKIKGSMYIGNPADLYKPILLTQERAREHCHSVVQNHLNERSR